MTVRRLWPRLAVLAVLVAVGVLLRLTVFAPAPVPVRTVAAEKGRVEETVTNSRAGTVKARRRAKLAPETGGRVLLLPRRRGTRVRKGELLLRVDDALQRAQLRLSGDESKAVARPARPGLPRRRAGGAGPRAHARLSKDGLVSAEILDRVESEARAADAACRAARAAAERARLGGGPRPGPARQDRPPRALRRHRGRHLHRGGRVDLALAAGAPHPARPRPHRHRARSTSARRWTRWTPAASRRASRRGSPWTRAPAALRRARRARWPPTWWTAWSRTARSRSRSSSTTPRSPPRSCPAPRPTPRSS